MKLPHNFNTWNKALRGAYSKGYRAAMEHLPKTACPYEDKRKPSGKLSWSRSFINAWDDGWESGNEQRKQDAITSFYNDGIGKGTRPHRFIR